MIVSLSNGQVSDSNGSAPGTEKSCQMLLDSALTLIHNYEEEASLPLLNEVLKLDPMNQTALVKRAWMNRVLGRTNAFYSAVQDLNEKYPKSPDALLFQGLQYADEGEVKKAARSFQKSGSAAAIESWGYMLWDEGDVSGVHKLISKYNNTWDDDRAILKSFFLQSELLALYLSLPDANYSVLADEDLFESILTAWGWYETMSPHHQRAQKKKQTVAEGFLILTEANSDLYFGNLESKDELGFSPSLDFLGATFDYNFVEMMEEELGEGQFFGDGYLFNNSELELEMQCDCRHIALQADLLRLVEEVHVLLHSSRSMDFFQEMFTYPGCGRHTPGGLSLVSLVDLDEMGEWTQLGDWAQQGDLHPLQSAGATMAAIELFSEIHNRIPLHVEHVRSSLEFLATQGIENAGALSLENYHAMVDFCESTMDIMDWYISEFPNFSNVNPGN